MFVLPEYIWGSCVLIEQLAVPVNKLTVRYMLNTRHLSVLSIRMELNISV